MALRPTPSLASETTEAVALHHPETSLFAKLPGAGAVLQPRLIVAFGTQRDRYASASEVQAYFGIAPVSESRGHSRWVHVRWACPTFLRQTFHEFAACSVSRSECVLVFYDVKIAAGKSHHAAVRALAYQWIRVLFRCWKDGCPYDERTYLQVLAKRNSLLTRTVGTSTKMGGELSEDLRNCPQKILDRTTQIPPAPSRSQKSA